MTTLTHATPFADDCGAPPSWCTVEGELQHPFDTVVIDLGPTTSMVSVQVRDMGTGTIYFEVSLDGAEWLPQQLLNTAQPVFSSETTVDGNWQGAIAGWKQFRVRAGNPYSGSFAQITLMTSEAALSGVPGPAYVFIGPEPPLNPVPGTLWWSNVLGELFIWYDDGNTSQWVVTSLGGNTVGRMGSLNLRDYMYDDIYVNNAFQRAQTALLNANLRDLYVPGGTYYADPAKPEIQLVLDDLHIWADNAPVFMSTNQAFGFFQVLYGHRVKVEGIRVVLDPSIVRTTMSGNYAGDKYNSRRGAICLYDCNDFQTDRLFVRNWCGGVIGKGYHTNGALDAWKLLSPAQRIATYMDLTSTKSMGDFPDQPSSARRLGGRTRIFGLRSEHCDFGILYNSVENMRIDDFECKDTTITQAFPHAIYAAGNITSNVQKYDEEGNPIGWSDPDKPPYVVLKDKSNGTCKATNLRDYDNPYGPSFKFRVHDQVTVSDAYSQSAGGGLVFNNSDGALLDGATIVDVRGGLPSGGDEEDDDPKNSTGLQLSGCRDGIFKNVNMQVQGGTPNVSPVFCTDTHGSNQRINPDTGELICSRNNKVQNVFVRTNYANGDLNRVYTTPPFDPTGLDIKPVFQVGDDGGSFGTGWSFENCQHVDAYGYYPTEMFHLRSGSGHRIITPSRMAATQNLVRVHGDCTDNLIVIDPDLVESRKVNHLPLPPPGNDYTRVHVIRPVKGDNVAYLADFGPLDTSENVAETMNRAALIVGRRGPGTIHLPAGELLAGPFVPNQISPTEGTTIILTAAMSGITWQGHSTVFKLISNRVAVFEIDGATNSKFRSIKFDNSEHGYLNHNPGSATGGPGLGVAANGNAANCAIRQWTGANLTAWDCDFVAIHSGVQYIGNYLDIAQLVGTADVQNCRFDGCVMGFLPSQAEHVVCNGNFWLNGWDSFRPAPGAPGAVAPGHMLYITNSAGAAPYTVVANNNYARHSAASVLKMRKGVAQTCVGNVFEGVQGGIECHNAKNTTITGNTIKLQLWPTNRIPLGRPESEGYAAGDGTAATAIVVSGCYGGGVVANNTIDKAGHAGYAIRIRAADLAEDPEGEVEDGQYPRNLHVHDNTISDSCEEIMIQTRPDIDGDPLPPMSVAPIAPWMLLTHLTDCIVENNVLHITADVDSEQWMIRADLCERTKFLNNSRTNPFLSEGSDRIIMLGSGCSNCVVGTRMEDIPIADTGPMVSDSGTNTRRLYTDGILIEEWTPVPSFETLGDFDPVITHAEGWIERQGQMATVGGNLAFDTNAYSLPGAGGPDGFFKILFPYELRNASGGVYNAVGYHSRFAIPTDSMGVAMHAHENFLTLRYNQTGTDGARLTTAHIPPSTLAVEVNFQIRVQLQPSGPFDHVILPETQKLLDAGWTPSTTTVLQRVDKCIRDLKSYGLWDKILACWGKNSLLNWKNPGTYTMVPVGAPLFIEDDYFAGLGTNTDYYLTGLNLATQGAGLYTLNAASMWRWSDTDLLSDTAADMGNDAKSLVHGMTLAGQLQCFTNSAVASLAPSEHSTGLAGWTRTDAANVILFKSRDSTPGSAASTSIQSAPLRIGHGGVGGSGSARRLKFAGVGGALTAEELLQLERVINNYAQF